MDPKLEQLYQRLKAAGLAPEQEEKILRELRAPMSHGEWPERGAGRRGEPGGDPAGPVPLYGWNDLAVLHALAVDWNNFTLCLKSLDELIARDRRREQDGFPRKIQVGRLVKPGKGGKDKVVVVPTTVEEKLIHDEVKAAPDAGGSGEGEEGEVIGEQPVREEGEAGAGGAGQGGGEGHEMESSAYDLGRILTEQFQLPNLRDKGKKRSFTRYTYDLTDRHRGFGQVLDKKATLRRIVETNIHLGRISGAGEVDPAGLMISPDDKVYRVLSKEKDYESQAMVFFVRDYSGSMSGKPTELVVTQHVLIYSWLLYQYDRQVETRFILHDSEAKEVPDFYTYYNSRVAGGTQVASAYRLVNEIVDKDNLGRDYNIYVFHGTDGDDWDAEGKETLPELRRMMAYASRVGVTVVRHGYGASGPTEMERYLQGSRLPQDQPGLLRLDVMAEDADEARLIEGIKTMTAE